MPTHQQKHITNGAILSVLIGLLQIRVNKIATSPPQQNKMRFQEEDDYEETYVELPNIRGKASPKRSSRPITANLADTQYEVVEQVCWDLDWNIVLEKDSKHWDIRWVDSAVSVDMLSKMQSHQKINHFPGMNVLSRKNNLAKNLYKMQAAYPQHYSYAPKTFLLPADLSLLRTYYNDSRKRGVVKTFIVKPEASCQGRGIFLTQNLSDIQLHGQCVVQSYVDNPLLYKGLKFDMRIYALVAGCDPLRIYIYNEGLVRFATEKYETAEEHNLDNLYMHLTNYAINKDSPKYIFNESLENLSQGHKKSLAEFFQTLKAAGLPAQDYWSSIKDIIVKTVISGQPHLQHEYRMAQPHNLANNMCFEILGFDFMVDDNNKMYLLEINYTPSFSTETPLDHLIKSNLIRDTLLLMNVTTQARNQAQRAAKEELDRRVYTGKSHKLTAEEKKAMVKELQHQRDQYEKKNLGSFERIFPCKNPQRQQKYDLLLEYSLNQYKQSSSPQKIVHSRRSSSKYRIKRIISNTTTCEEQPRENQSPKSKARQHGLASLNPESMEKTPIIGKSKQKALNPINDTLANPSKQLAKLVQPRVQPRHPPLGTEIRGIDLSSLRTRNQQMTMFSRQLRAADFAG